MRGDGEADHVAVGVADGGMPMGYRGAQGRRTAATKVRMARANTIEADF